MIVFTPNNLNGKYIHTFQRSLDIAMFDTEKGRCSVRIIWSTLDSCEGLERRALCTLILSVGDVM